MYKNYRYIQKTNLLKLLQLIIVLEYVCEGHNHAQTTFS